MCEKKLRCHKINKGAIFFKDGGCGEDFSFQIRDGRGISTLAVTCFAKLPRFKNSKGIFKV